MKYLLVLVCFFLLNIILIKPEYKLREYIKIDFNSPSYSDDTIALLTATITGDKKKLNKTTKNNFKKYGLLHLLTPSGLHLSSLFFIKFLRPSALFIFLSFVFIVLSRYESYHSMERVLMFKLLYILAKKYQFLTLNIIFILTISISMVLGHFQTNPFSFIYSFIFWATVLIFKDSKLKLILFLNISLHISSAFYNEPTQISSIFINFFFTSIYTMYFPLMLVLHFCQISFLQSINDFTLNLFTTFLNVFSEVDPFPSVILSPITLSIFSIFIIKKRFKLSALIIFFLIPMNKQDLERNYKRSIYRVESRSCEIGDLKINCKKKPSKKRAF